MLWAGPWLVRIWLAVYLLIYAWSKVFLLQMGLADFADESDPRPGLAAAFLLFRGVRHLWVLFLALST